ASADTVNGITTSGGDITLATGGAITVSQNIDTGGAAGTVTLNPSTGGVTATAATITADALLLLGPGTFDLANPAGHNVGRLSANIAGSLDYTGAGGFTVDSVGGTNGITTGGGAVHLVALNGGELASSAGNDINTSSTSAAGGNVTLESTDGGGT